MAGNGFFIGASPENPSAKMNDKHDKRRSCFQIRSTVQRNQKNFGMRQSCFQIRSTVQRNQENFGMRLPLSGKLWDEAPSLRHHPSLLKMYSSSTQGMLGHDELEVAQRLLRPMMSWRWRSVCWARMSWRWRSICWAMMSWRCSVCWPMMSWRRLAHEHEEIIILE